jgi:hypothetical protein
VIDFNRWPICAFTLGTFAAIFVLNGHISRPRN